MVPYNIQARFSLVDLADVALAAARVLTESGHDGAIYELAGPEKLSSEDMALKLTVRLGGPVNAVQIPLQEWELSASSSGMPTGTVGALAAMFRYYDKYGLIGNGNVLGWLLERSPTSLSQFLERTFAD